MKDTGRFRRLRGVPPIKELMTPFPYSIGPRATLTEARRMMEEHDFRHLPVKDGERLVGVVTDRDLELAAPPTGAVTGEPTVGDVAAEPYVVDLWSPSDQVLATMAERHAGAALVVKEGRLAGIFTMTDAYRRFEELLHKLFPPDAGDVA